MQISTNIKRIRELKGISQQKMADEIGEKRSTYAEWERETEPKASILIKIAKVLGVKVSELMEGFDEISTNETVKEDIPGYIKTDRYLSRLEQENAFLRRNFETSLTTILEVQQQAGNQLGALTWYSALVANGRDEKKAAADLSEIHNNIASFEEVGSGDDNSQTNNNKRTSAKRKVRK